MTIEELEPDLEADEDPQRSLERQKEKLKNIQEAIDFLVRNKDKIDALTVGISLYNGMGRTFYAGSLWNTIGINKGVELDLIDQWRS